ncbi:MAG: ATP-binding protein, partial [Kiritimatiellae bacterium]|nr:ATP-binding protein [Kiritimatiellia bacterium]
RVDLLHTTFIPFHEHARLLGTDDIDEYIEFGGTLKIGDRRFGHPDARREEASFRDDETTRFYIDTAIARNIQHSLKSLESGGHFRHLRELYEAGELTDAINRVVEDMNHRFVLDVLTRRFTSHDLGSAADLLMKTADPERSLDVYASIDVAAVTARLKDILEIRERENRTIGVTDAHVREIREYLLALDLLVPVEIRTEEGAPLIRDAFVQPGLRYAQAQALVYALGRDPSFNRLAGTKAKALVECILDDIKGRMLEDIVLLETRFALPSSPNPFDGFGVFKLQFASGEFDMVVCDNAKRTCRLFEIKHSGVAVEAQRRHLADEAKLRFVRDRLGDIDARTVLYRGDDMVLADGIRYQNVNSYLISLPTA